jgi:septum formation protein
MKIILGSSSPRRKDILNYFSLPYRIESPDIDEEAILFEGNPGEYVKKIALEKGKALIQRFPESIIITADTTVYFEGKVYNKPHNDLEAFQMLKSLVGKRHEVHTGVCVTSKDRYEVESEKNIVEFKELSDNEIHLYQQAIHCFDKAGGYAIQGAGSLIVKRIEGCYTNSMGLPITTLSSLLKSFGVDLWNFL